MSSGTLSRMSEPAKVRTQSTATIEKATGIGWDEWVAYLDQAGAQRLSHAEIASISAAKMPDHVRSVGWWAQGVAVAYEHQKGLRLPGQASDGKFTATVSKTFAGDKDAALNRWMELVAGREEFGQVPVEDDPTTSATEKWRYWRVKLADGTRVTVTISDKAGGKSTVAVQHSKLESDADLGSWKQWWKEQLNQL